MHEFSERQPVTAGRTIRGAAMKRVLCAIATVLALAGHASAALKPLAGTLELACRQIRLDSSGKRTTVYFRTIANMRDIGKAVRTYNAGSPVPPGFKPLFNLLWSATAQEAETACVQVKGDSDDFSGRYLLRVVTARNKDAKFFDDTVKGELLDDILYESPR